MNAPAFHLVRPPVALQPLLSVKHVSLEYRTEQRTVRATHDVSFDVFRGDRFVLLGPSGCGKSSLLKAVAGFIAPRKVRTSCSVSAALCRILRKLRSITA